LSRRCLLTGFSLLSSGAACRFITTLDSVNPMKKT
jgi:hypothetical protein